jgi:hypothetical protein
MTSERAKAYRRVMKAMADLGPGKLHPSEQNTIRAAADALLFAQDERATGVAMAPVLDLAQHLVESERLLRDTADQILRDLMACGPQTSFAAAA